MLIGAYNEKYVHFDRTYKLSFRLIYFDINYSYLLLQYLCSFKGININC